MSNPSNYGTGVQTRQSSRDTTHSPSTTDIDERIRQQEEEHTRRTRQLEEQIAYLEQRRRDNDGNRGYIPKVECQPYKSGQSPIQWWEIYMQWAALMQMAPIQALKEFPFRAGSMVQTWYQKLEDRVKNNMDALKQAFVNRFQTKSAYDLGILSLKQDKLESVQDYFHRVDKELVDHDVTESLLIGIVVNGLLPELTAIVMPQQPQTLEAARNAAMVAERTLKVTRQPVNDNLAATITASMMTLGEQLRQTLTTEVATLQSNHADHRGSRQYKRPPQYRQPHPQSSTYRQPHYQPPAHRQFQQQAELQPTWRRQGQQNRYQPDQNRECYKCGTFWTLTQQLKYIFITMILFSTVVGSMEIKLTPAKEVQDSHKDIINRINYGVVFKKQKDLYLASEYWLHTYEIKLPETIYDVPMPICTHSHESCHFINTIVMQINAIKLQTLATFNQTMAIIMSTIPQVKQSGSSRVQRSFLPFIGQLSKSFFGTATMDDVNILANHINVLIKRTRSMNSALVQHGEHMSSYISVANARMDNLKEGIEENFLAIRRMLHSFRYTYSHLESTLINTSSILIDQVTKANHLQQSLLSLQFSIQSLVTGKLTPFLLPVETLSKSITEIQQILRYKYPETHLVESHVSEMYKNANFFYTRNQTKLYITVKFPLTSQTHPLHLYKIISLPVPINNTSQHATQLLDLPDYVALTNQNQFHAHIQATQLISCQTNHHQMMCSFNLALTPISNMGCSLALFLDNKAKILELCDFRYLPSMLSPTLVELSPLSVLVYNIKQLSLTCPKTKQIVQGCTFCVLHLPCRCTLESQEVFFSSRLQNCQNVTTEVVKSHPVNLALLQAFFKPTDLRSLTGESTFLDPINISVPKFKIYNHSFTSFLANDKKAHLSLQKMAHSAKKDEMIFQHLAEPLLDGQLSLNNNWPDLNAILIFSMMAFGTLTFLLCMWSFFKVRKLNTVLLVLQNAHHVKSAGLPSFYYRQPTTTESTENISIDILSEFTWLHGSVIIASIALIILIIITCVLYKTFKSRKGTTLLLELTNGSECVIVPIVQLPLCASYWSIQAPTTITSLKLFRSYFKTKLTLKWPGFKVTNKLTKQSLDLPESLKLSPPTYLAVKRILTKPYCAYILVSHGGLSFVLNSDDHSMPENRCDLSNDLNVPKLNNLYPDLHN